MIVRAPIIMLCPVFTKVSDMFMLNIIFNLNKNNQLRCKLFSLGNYHHQRIDLSSSYISKYSYELTLTLLIYKIR